MTVLVNGAPVELAHGAAVADAVAISGTSPNARGVAVARNGEVVPRGEWATTALAAGDKIEVLTAVAGG